MKVGDLVKFDGDLNLKNRGIGIVIDVKEKPQGARVYWARWKIISPWVYMDWLQEIK